MFCRVAAWRRLQPTVRLQLRTFRCSAITLADEYAFTLQEVTKGGDGSQKILNNIHLSFFHGAKIGVIGSNGSGKSSLIRIMAGVDKQFDGTCRKHPRLKLGYLAQEPTIDTTRSVTDNVTDGLHEVRAMLKEYDTTNEALGQEGLSPEQMDALLQNQGELQERLDAAAAWDLDREVASAMEALRVPVHNADISTLSGGEVRRVALARLVLSRPELLLLDEPTNHLDAGSVAWLERYLAKFKGTVVCVTHDRYFLDNVAEWILELRGGSAYPFKGNYTAWLEKRQREIVLEERTQKKLDRAMERELEWIRSGVKARQAKNKARVKRYEEMLKKPAPERYSAGTIYIPAGPRLGDVVIRAHNLKKSYNGRVLFENVNFSLPPGAIVGIVGPNGAGKSTLFRIITGREEADEGTLSLGKTVKLGMVDQTRVLTPLNTVHQEIGENNEYVELGHGETKIQVNARKYVAWFNFRGNAQQKLCRDLSGGERNRVFLARLVKEGANVILLDEPTNDLDVDTLRSLEAALEEFGGCSVVISHDRWFLDRVATHILAFEGTRVVWFEGNYAEYVADKEKRTGVADSVVASIKA